MTSGVSPLPCSAIGFYTLHGLSCGQRFYYLCHFDSVLLTISRNRVFHFAQPLLRTTFLVTYVISTAFRCTISRNRVFHFAQPLLRTAFLLLISFRQRSAVPYPAIGCYTSHSPSCGQRFYYLCHFDQVSNVSPRHATHATPP